LSKTLAADLQFSGIGGEVLSSRAMATDTHTVVAEIVTEMSPSGVTEVRTDTSLIAELGFDSLGIVEVLVALEDTLNLPSLAAEQLGDLQRVGDLERVVNEAQARNGQGSRRPG
jgi:acyl carrier protein